MNTYHHPKLYAEIYTRSKQEGVMPSAFVRTTKVKLLMQKLATEDFFSGNPAPIEELKKRAIKISTK